VANLQIKGIDDALYTQIKELAASENRSISQQILFLVKRYIASKKQFEKAKTSAQVLLELSGSWEDNWGADEIISVAMFLLDTDTVIYNLKGNANVQKNLRQHINDSIKISVITLMELYYGARKSQKVFVNLAKIKILEQSIETIPVGLESTEIFGLLKAQLEISGNRLDDFDLIIASCAMAHNLTLVTNNTKHFKRIDGLKLANWA
jgi:tRNA(fMet)-specific endonuclease VapC